MSGRGPLGFAGARAAAAARFVKHRPAVISAAALMGAALAAVLFWSARPAVEIAPADAGRAYLAAGDYRSAVETLRAAYRAAPSEALRLDLARALLASSDFSGALDVLRAPDDGSVDRSAYLQAEAMIGAGQYSGAAALAETVIATRPTDARAMLIAARASYALGDLAGAQHWLGEALRTRGEALAESWLFRARLALDANDLGTAESATARAEESGAAPRALAFAKAERLMRQGDFVGARAALAPVALSRNKKSSQTPDAPRAFLAARIEAAAGDYDSAARHLRSIGAYYESQPNGALVAALIRAHAGDAAQAESLFREAIDAAPANAALLDGFAGFLLSAGRAGEAADILARLETAAPYDARLRRAALALGENRSDAALSAAKRAAMTVAAPSANAIAFGPAAKATIEEDAALAPARALIAAERVLPMGDAPALRRAADNLAGRETTPAALALAGELRLAAGDDEAGGALFDEALALSPDFAAARFGRLRCYLAGDKTAAAEHWLLSILARTPHSEFARAALARVLRSEGRTLEAAATLRPIANDIAKNASVAMLYGNLLIKVGAHRELASFADSAARAAPGAAFIADFYEAAGLGDQAAAAARDALVNAPRDEALAARYLALMAGRGRLGEAREFLQALARRAGALAGPERAPANVAAEGASPPDELGELKAAHRLAPEDPEAASRYGRALEAAGEKRLGARLLREACFWGSAAECPPATGSAS